MIGLILLFAALPYADCHSWVERLSRVASNGTMIGDPGYIRGAVSRTDPSFTDLKMQSLLLNIQAQLCRDSQATMTYSDGLQPLRAYPGDFVALQYQENGHVTLPGNTPQKAGSGNVSVYGTFMPREREKLSAVHKLWNRQGTGGDRRGRLLGRWDFDDGRCYQINDGPMSTLRQTKFSKPAADPEGADLWCQIDVQLPLDLVGWYTLYWVWDWPSSPTATSPQGEMEVYTSCMDVEVLPGTREGPVSYIAGQDLNFAAIEEQMMHNRVVS